MTAAAKVSGWLSPSLGLAHLEPLLPFCLCLLRAQALFVSGLSVPSSPGPWLGFNPPERCPRLFPAPAAQVISFVRGALATLVCASERWQLCWLAPGRALAGGGGEGSGHLCVCLYLRRAPRPGAADTAPPGPWCCSPNSRWHSACWDLNFVSSSASTVKRLSAAKCWFH